MRVTVPVTIADAQLTSSTAVEPGAGEVAYNAGTAYAIGDVCYSTTAHRRYESLTAANTGNALPVLPETQTDHWIDIGPTNKWAMFDLYTSSQTEYTSPLTVVVTPGQRINTIGLTGLVADQVEITATSSGTPVYSYVEDLTIREVLDHYMYAFEPFRTRPSTVVFDIPPISNIIITISITRVSGNVKCGSFVTGLYTYIGGIKYNA